jgi:thymidylate kinase
VREGYRQIAADEPGRFRLIDGDRPVDEIARDVWDTVAELPLR